MFKFTVKRSEWLRGEGEDDSYLLRSSDNKKCCFGFLAIQRGIPEEAIKDVHSFAEMPSEFMKQIPQGFLNEDNYMFKKANVTRVINADEATEAMVTNDMVETSDSEKEKELAERFKELNVQVEFID